MNSSERLIAEYLKHSGYADIRFEPDGNIPPDFVISGRIAVEVRRLNQNYGEPLIAKGLEEEAIPLRDKVRNLLKARGGPQNGRSWWVYFRFSRPVPDWDILRQRIEDSLTDFMGQAHQETGYRYWIEGFELQIHPAENPRDRLFLLAGYTDRDSGGWLVPEIKTNIVRCIEQKSRKIAPYRARYPVWWLALVDRVGYGLDESDQSKLRDLGAINKRGFDRVILVDPHDHRRWFEI